MKRKIDKLGRIVLPSEMRNELKLEKSGVANIEVKRDEIIISNPMTVSLRESLEQIVKDNEENGFVEIDVIKKLLDI